jgi:hypothetical protein
VQPQVAGSSYLVAYEGVHLSQKDLFVGCVVFFCADNWDQQTAATFDKPINVAGIVLTSGTYLFKLSHASS